ncbi:23S rRNA pseudouridine1911/1915/1917 synthase [Inhella inkyongensis]|uniref:Pseudouridine synthase n=1 Tax=Inhella inkyongensis TaxID=392593 RepID=A0A840S2U4_9BURK|nr:RluA family pseudouridine synthase [Inhella inkyongensis]MBB5203728.1 23S rRNA pseudouridine1911/1915/1917 synthase [Inhella inkyongensis]
MGTGIIGSDVEALSDDSDEVLGEGAGPQDWSGRVPVDAMGLRLDQWLVSLYPGYSRSHAQQLIEAGAVRLEGVVCSSASRRLRPGQLAEVSWRLPQHAVPFEPEALPIDRVFEDDTLLVMNKPAGWVVHPAAGNWSGTVLNALLAHHAGAAQLPRAGIVHRLDKDTTGLMVVAKSLAAYHDLVAQLAARTVKREYLALCHGRVEAAFSVDAPIGRDTRVRTRMAVSSQGKEARTDFDPLRVGAAQSLLHCQLHSGRTHQIRVHAAHRGHPLVGDVLYGGRAQGGLSRQGLHAARLSLCHPQTGVHMSWIAPPPLDLQQAALELLGAPIEPLAPRH